ncbi:TPA: tRNA (guanosine(37)-N1)-methyltransferase TrmD [Candidatus Falkowbacteria bacterium]|nr:MAG: tRNA (guanine-N(1)-)-methyltransferase [Candidatus Falkowbacteria bacterium GW2011_GWF2_43_32]HBA36815.1 tRNA (guanosine(37)-N1)-methyltransferase TrmD [Candidatus Falkowbacteria bacterium]
MKFHLLTIFPAIFDSYLNESILKRAQNKKIVKFQIHNLRDWTKDRHRTVDDAPYGGGAGMLMKIEPLYDALNDIKKLNKKIRPTKRKIILLSAAGKTWTQKSAQKHANLEEVILICGRYEGVDARLKKFIDEEISVGDYVLTGGELPALTVIDSIVRLLPGVLGNENSIIEESHATAGVTEYPQYTRPAVFTIGRKKYSVPKILLSGDPKKIKAWQDKQQKKVK